MKEKRKCQSIAKRSGNQCENPPLLGVPYCWHHYPKKEPFIFLLLGALLGFALSVAYDTWTTSPEEKGISEIKTEVRKGRSLDETAAAVSQEPVIQISEWSRADNSLRSRKKGEPLQDTYGGLFTFCVTNSGINDVLAVDLYQDCFVTDRDARGELVLQPFGKFTNKPITNFPSLLSGQSEHFTVDIRRIYREMSDFALQDPRSPRMEVVRLGAQYRRKVDGKRFEYYRMYLVFGPATQLISPDTRGMKLGAGSYLPIDEVKKMLKCAE